MIIKVKKKKEKKLLSLGHVTGREAQGGDPTAIGLPTQLISYKFVALLHLMGDILQATNNLNRMFQARDLCAVSIKGEVIMFHPQEECSKY